MGLWTCPNASKDGTRLSDHDVYRLLADDRRRLALTVLGRRSPPLDVRTLAEEMLELDRGGERVSEDEIRRLTVELYHRHLPMMAEVGVIDVDESGKRVQATRVGTPDP